ncbi:MAG: SpoIIIAH-like family protein [Bacilli bacterium]
MINKQGLWFLTLFSLILVLSIYYITMPNEIFKSEEVTEQTKEESDAKDEETSEVNSQNTSYIETLKIELDSERAEILDTLQEILNDKTKTSDEKNKAYEQMKEINNLKASEEQISKKIKEEYSLSSYVKQEDSNIEIVIDSDDHDVKLANKIMRSVQEEFDEAMSISIKFS